MPDYRFLQNKLIKAHRNKLVKARNENGWYFEKQGYFSRCLFFMNKRLCRSNKLVIDVEKWIID